MSPLEEKITGQIEFTGSTIDQKSGGLTGTDTLGGLWYSTLRIGNDTFLRSEKILLERGVMMEVPCGLIWTETVILAVPMPTISMSWWSITWWTWFA